MCHRFNISVQLRKLVGFHEGVRELPMVMVGQRLAIEAPGEEMVDVYEPIEVSVYGTSGQLLRRHTRFLLRSSHAEEDNGGLDGKLVTRRFRDFEAFYLHLLRRFPFRLVPCLPPKRFKPSAVFLQTRAEALKRFMQMVLMNGTFRNDPFVHCFIAEPEWEEAFDLEDEFVAAKVPEAVDARVEEHQKYVNSRLHEVLAQLHAFQTLLWLEKEKQKQLLTLDSAKDALDVRLLQELAASAAFIYETLQAASALIGRVKKACSEDVAVYERQVEALSSRPKTPEIEGNILRVPSFLNISRYL